METGRKTDTERDEEIDRDTEVRCGVAWYLGSRR
jgi:hypothetical protein